MSSDSENYQNCTPPELKKMAGNIYLEENLLSEKSRDRYEKTKEKNKGKSDLVLIFESYFPPTGGGKLSSRESKVKVKKVTLSNF